MVDSFCLLGLTIHNKGKSSKKICHILVFGRKKDYTIQPWAIYIIFYWNLVEQSWRSWKIYLDAAMFYTYKVQNNLTSGVPVAFYGSKNRIWRSRKSIDIVWTVEEDSWENHDKPINKSTKRSDLVRLQILLRWTHYRKT